MPCESPLKAWRPASSGPLQFNRPTDGHAYTPIEIPCGRCILCRQEEARQWGVRLTHEGQFYEENSFVTLSYDDEHLPEFGSLRYEDLVKFWKRARKRFGKMRYFAVGEYGDTTLRPHYHAIIFGHAFTENRRILRTTPTLLWTSPELEKCWGQGHVAVGALTFQTAQYTASYVLKKLTKKQQYVRLDMATGELIPLQQPDRFMSKNLAKQWWWKYGQQVEDHDLVIINGRKQKPPKAYDKWSTEPRADFIVSPGGITWRAAQELGKQKLEKRKEQRNTKAPTETDEQRRARARNAHARARSKSKKV